MIKIIKHTQENIKRLAKVVVDSWDMDFIVQYAVEHLIKVYETNKECFIHDYNAHKDELGNFYVVNMDNKTITKCETKDEAQALRVFALTKSPSANVYYYNEIEFKKLEVDKSKFETFTTY